MEIIIHPNPILNQRAEEVTAFDEALQSIVNDMTDLVNTPSLELAGISGNQVGILKRVFVATMGTNKDGTKNIITFINPKIKPNKKLGIEKNWEGCTSLPNFVYLINRYKEITVTAQNVYGVEFNMILRGHMAYVVQHETDHLNGINLVDKKVFQKKAI